MRRTTGANRRFHFGSFPKKGHATPPRAPEAGAQPAPTAGGARVRRTLRVLTNLALVALALLVGWYAYHRHALTRVAQTRLEQLTGQVTVEIGSQLGRIEAVARSLEGKVAAGGLSEEQLVAEFKVAVSADPRILEAGVAYVRDKGPGGPGLFAPHYGLRAGKHEAFRVEAAYDYTSAEWFKDALANGPCWTSPYFGQASGVWVVGYGIPLRAAGAAPSEPPIGVLRVNLSMEQIRRYLGSLPLGSEGYAAIARLDSTRMIYHPIEEFVKDRLTMFDIAEKRGDAKLFAMGKAVAKGERGMMERPATLTGETAWNFYGPVVGTNWNVILIFVKDEALADGGAERHGRVAIAVLLVFLLSLLSLRVLRIETGAPRRMWISAGVVTLLLGGAVGYIWYLSFDPRIFNDVQRGMVFDRVGRQRFESDRKEMARQRGEPEPIFVPTGIFVRAMEFKNATDVIVKGYAWQKLGSKVKDRVTPGFNLPEALDAEVTESYRHANKDEEVIGWSFRATLRQQLDFRRYPLDFQKVRLLLSRKDFDRNVIFVPDLAAYQSMIPQARPGLERSFVMAGWQLEKTFFSHANSTFNTNFGIERFVGGDQYPDLEYNAIIRRDFGSPFIGNIIPLLLIAGIGFAVLMMIHREPDRIAAYDARGGRVTGTSAALFFAVLLAHIRLRNELVGLRETIYIEYFYFVMYASCLAIVADALAVASRTPPRWLQYRDNFLPKVIYWPTIAAAVLAITVGFFY